MHLNWRASKRWLAHVVVICALSPLSGCDPVENTPGSPTGTLCFDYFQRCVYPLALDAALPIDRNNDGVFEAINTCSASGCHQEPGTSGGALRVAPGLTPVDLNTMTVDQVRATTLYATFKSVTGSADIDSPRQSNLLRKPLVEVSHGGGRVFASDQDSAARQLLFWITNRAPAGGDEFSAQCASLFAAGNLCQPF